MNKISCNVIQDLLPLYMDQVVSEDSRILVEEHLKECQKCRTCLSEMEAEVPISYDEEQREKAKQELKNFQKFLSRKKEKNSGVFRGSCAGCIYRTCYFFKPDSDIHQI